MQKEEYLKLVDRISTVGSKNKTFISSFCVGGFICSFGEILRQFFLFLNFSVEDSSFLVSSIIILIAAFLTAIGVFHKISNFAGAGTFVPITGFSNSIVSAALEFKTNGFVLGVGANMFIIAGPVIVYGVCSSVVCGMFFYLVECFGGKI